MHPSLCEQNKRRCHALGARRCVGARKFAHREPALLPLRPFFLLFSFEKNGLFWLPRGIGYDHFDFWRELEDLRDPHVTLTAAVLRQLSQQQANQVFVVLWGRTFSHQ